MTSRIFYRLVRAGLAAIVLVATVTGCIAPRRPISPASPGVRRALPAAIRVRAGGSIVSVPLEDYVLDTVLSEVSPTNETRAVAAAIFEAQTIVARTYAVSRLGRHASDGFDVCDSTHCQLYQPERRQTSRFTSLATEAVNQTRGLLLLHNGSPIEALFHADCGGVTTGADDVWGGMALPYLRRVDDQAPAGTHRPWRVTASTERLLNALNADSRTAVGLTLASIEIASRDESGRAAIVTLRGERSLTVRGDLFRTVVNRTLGDRAILSTLFTITRSQSGYTLAGTGFGHGVGLCQRGAARRLRHGAGPGDVLAFYYPGTRLAAAGN